MTMPTLSPMQDKAVHAFTDWRSNFSLSIGSRHDLLDVPLAEYFYLGGYAGTGKSTILPVIVDSTGLDLSKIIFCAPTGKAAKVMTTKMRQFGMGATAHTIHSLIYRPRGERVDLLEQKLTTELTIVAATESILNDQKSSPQQIAEAQETRKKAKVAVKQLEIDLKKAFDNKEGPTFQFNTESSVRDASLIVVDEGSMVGSSIADDLRSFGIPILVMADPGQLPPVKSDPGFCVRDPDFFLTEIHRQAADNPIIKLSSMVRDGFVLKPMRMGNEVEVISRNNDTATFNLDREAQVIVGTNKRRWNVNMRLRSAMGYKSQGPSEGEPLIVCRNSKTVPGLVNGSFVTCMETVEELVDGESRFVLSIRTDEGNDAKVYAYQSLFEENIYKTKGKYTCSVRAALDAQRACEHIDWGHTITCHKSQGSQWNDVIVHDESGVFGEESHRWLYTAVTRAADRLTVVL